MSIPKFLLRRLYKKGSLRTSNDSTKFELTNILGPGIILGLNSITINEKSYEPKDITISTNGKDTNAQHISPENPMFFSFMQLITCILEGEPAVKPGPNNISMEVVSREAGVITVSVKDNLAGAV